MQTPLPRDWRLVWARFCLSPGLLVLGPDIARLMIQTQRKDYYNYATITRTCMRAIDSRPRTPDITAHPFIPCSALLAHRG